MDIKPHKITVRQLAEGFREGNYDEGVSGYGGDLDIRPPYQREFIYDEKDQEAVIQTALRDYPLNVMYWADNGGGKFEVIDGQQRIISLCRFVQPDGFSITYNGKPQIFSGLPEDVRDALMDYSKFLVYVCTGTASEKLGWFQTINIAGKVLTAQEIRNAVYCGPWVASAKRHFSRPNKGAAVLAHGYFKAEVKRQALLEKAIMWHWNIAKDKIDGVMNSERDKQADELKQGFKAIIDWAKATFPPFSKYPKEIPFVDWGALYHAHGKDKLDAADIAGRVEKLMADKEVLNKKGIFHYVLDGNEQHLQLRVFDDDEKAEVWQEQGRKCGAGGDPWDKKNCPRDKELPFKDAQADHIKPWKDGGKTERDNCRVLCRWCNNAKRAK